MDHVKAALQRLDGAERTTHADYAKALRAEAQVHATLAVVEALKALQRP